MATLGRGRRQLASLLWKASVDDEVDAEFAFHVEMRTRELIAGGMNPIAARAAAEARFGDIRAVSDTCRSIGVARENTMKRTEYLAELAHDVRFAARQLWHARTFTAVAVLTLSLGIGASTAIFSAVESVVLRAFPYPHASDLVFAFAHFPFGEGAVSVGDYTDWQKRSTSFSTLAAFNFRGRTIANRESPERVTAGEASANAFKTFGVAPQLGRVFTEAEDQPGRSSVVVLSDGFWRRTFAADPRVLGRTLTLDATPSFGAVNGGRRRSRMDRDPRARQRRAIFDPQTRFDAHRRGRTAVRDGSRAVEQCSLRIHACDSRRA
jgi:hypothetical protein